MASETIDLAALFDTQEKRNKAYTYLMTRTYVTSNGDLIWQGSVKDGTRPVIYWIDDEGRMRHIDAGRAFIHIVLKQPVPDRIFGLFPFIALDKNYREY